MSEDPDGVYSCIQHDPFCERFFFSSLRDFPLTSPRPRLDRPPRELLTSPSSAVGHLRRPTSATTPRTAICLAETSASSRHAGGCRPHSNSVTPTLAIIP